ncbi:hypothetical protein GYMLUDRAFT_250871 [Collybiopsis luxurians FD-317 M1]|uniref:Unplaced genomic scaffold GYMLUscaffold_88, whole genome shotgun sequence n=1 Tax=Collybiopsis luxurians FD-317 M1 TaxID=944289 RepID=A0A0D0BE53_9AGAR|nr:hypothetical protein GYMLUDRAFT_250871 [Collybiopsis luxurians FD-317 M1]
MVPVLAKSASPPPVPDCEPPTDNLDQVMDECWVREPLTKFAQWFGYKEEAKEEDEEEEYEEDEWEDDWFEDEEMEEQMLCYAAAVDSSTKDEDWAESIQAAKKARRQECEKKECPMVYATGPNIAKKAPRTRRHYKAAMKTQSVLNNYGLTGKTPKSNEFKSSASSAIPSSPEASKEPAVCIRVKSEEPAFHVPMLSSSESNMNSSCTQTPAPAEPRAAAAEDSDMDDWEDELHDTAQACNDIRGWAKLQEQINSELTQAKKKGMPLAQMNQLTIIRNFATLRLKGFLHMQASQERALQWHESEGIFEQLPREKQGGLCTSQSLLSDENVRSAAQAWLTAQKVGNVTPQTFQQALNSEILPGLGIS